MAFKETYQVDAKQAERAFKALKKLEQEKGAETEKTTKALSAQEKQARRLSEMADPQKKYNRSMRELSEHVHAGRLEMGEAVKVATTYQQRLDRAGHAGKAAFGARALSAVSGYAAGLVSITAVASGITTIFRTLKEEAAEAATRVRESLDAVGELQQLEGFAGNTQFVRELRRKGVISDEGQAAKFAFALDSGGLSQADQNFVAYELVKNRFFSASEAPGVALAASKAQGLLGIGSLRETFQKLTQASGGTAANIPSLAAATTTFGSQFRTLGYSDNESLAALEIADKGSKNIDAAAERLKSFAVQVDKRGLGKGSFLATVNAIRNRIQAGENAYDILGETNAVAGFNLFEEAREQTAYRRSLGLIASAEQRDVLGGRLGGLSSDPIYGAALEAERAKSALEVGREDRRSELQNLFEATRDRLAAYYEGRGSTLGSLIVRGNANIDDFLGTEKDYLSVSLQRERNLESHFGGDGAFSQEFEARLLKYLERSADSNERTADAVSGNSNPAGE